MTETLGDVFRGKVIRYLCELFEEHLEGVRGILGLLFLASHSCFPLIVVYTASRDRLMASLASSEQKVRVDHDDAIKSSLGEMNMGFVTFPNRFASPLEE